jgi:hypothetical protein
MFQHISTVKVQAAQLGTKNRSVSGGTKVLDLAKKSPLDEEEGRGRLPPPFVRGQPARARPPRCSSAQVGVGARADGGERSGFL